MISEPDYIEVCHEYGFDWIYADNNPLGDKINAGLKKALKYNPDYIMMMNSDSVIKPELLNVWYRPYMVNEYEFFGVDTVTYVDSKTNEAREVHYPLTVLGVAKMLKASTVERCFRLQGEVYRSPLNKGLDNTMQDNLERIGIATQIVKYEGQLVYDIKSDVNIWPWEFFENKGKKVQAEICYKVRSDVEN